MGSYELMYILRPVLSEEQVDQMLTKYSNFLNERGAQDLQVQILGKRRLAYEIENHSDGIYIQMNFQADGSSIAPLERDMRLSDEVIRYLTIKQNKTKVKSSESPEVED